MGIEDTWNDYLRLFGVEPPPATGTGQGGTGNGGLGGSPDGDKVVLPSGRTLGSEEFGKFIRFM